MKRILFGLSALLLSACGGGSASSSLPAAIPATASQTSPSPNLSGAYLGTYTTSDGRTATLAFRLTQTGTTINGTLDEDAAFGDVSLRLNGAVTRTAAYFASGKTSNDCVVTFYTDANVQNITGTFTATACVSNNNKASRGSFAVTKAAS